MKVSELIEVLQGFDDDDVVVLSSDQEGNRYETLDEVVGGYALIEEGPREKTIKHRKMTPELEAQGYCPEEDVVDPNEPHENCVVLWP